MNVKQLLGALVAMVVRIAVAAVIIAAVFRLAVYSYDFGYRVFADLPVSGDGMGRTVSVVVSEGQGSRELAKMLEQKGLVSDANAFFIQAKLSECDGKLKPGTYELNTAMNAEEMLAILCNIKELPQD